MKADIIKPKQSAQSSEALVTASQLPKPNLAGPDRSNGNGRPAFLPQDRLQIDGVENLVDYFVLGSYLSQLSRAGLSTNQLFAVKLDEMRKIYHSSSTGEFKYALAKVAAAISDVIHPHWYLMSYAGDGLFICISDSQSLLQSPGLESEIQAVLDASNATYANGLPMPLAVSMGSPLRANASKTQRVKKTFRRVVARAKARASKKSLSSARSTTRHIEI